MYKKSIIIIIYILLFTLTAIPQQFIANLTEKQQIQCLICEYSDKYNLDRNIVLRLVAAESQFKITAKSNKQAFGLMQIQKETAKDMAKRLKLSDKIDLYNKHTNIKIGCFYLRYLLDRFNGNYRKALSAYNFGLGNVRNNRTLPQETKDYLIKILGE